MRKSLKSLMAVLFVFMLSCQLFAADGVVTFVKGKVEVKRGDSWIALNVGDKVKQSEMINTGFQSEAKVKLMDSILYLGPVTRVTLDTLASSNDRDKVNVYLSTGSVRSKVNRTETKRVSYTVRTPIAVASVRGTDWSIDCLNNVACYEGSVAVIPINQLLDMMNEKKSSDDEAKDESEDDDNESDDSEEPDDEELGSYKEESFKENEEDSDKSSDDNEKSREDDDNSLPSSKKTELDLSSAESLKAYEDAVNVPTSGVVLGPDMTVQVNSSSTINVPKHNVEKKRNDVLSGVTTESTKSDPTDASSNNVVKPVTGSLNVNLKLPQFGNLDVTVELPGSDTK